MNENIISKDVRSALINGIIGNELISCPFCKSEKMQIGQIKFMSNNKSISIQGKQVTIFDEEPYLPEILKHYKNFKHEENDKVLVMELICSSFDCPPTNVLFHMHAKGVSIEFGLPNTNAGSLRIKNNFAVQEETCGIVKFKHKETKNIIKLTRNKVMQAWFIGQKEVTVKNSNFFNYFISKVTTAGIPVSNWVKVDGKNYFRIFVIRNENLSTESLVCRFKFKDDNIKWVKGKDNLPIPPNQELIDIWNAPGNIDEIVPNIFNIVST